MLWRSRHLSDEELLLASDDDLSHRRLMRARRHLADCSTCQVRMTDIVRTLAHVTRLYRDRPAPPLPPAGQSRARLSRQIAAASARVERSLASRVLLRVREGRSAFALGLLLAAFAVGVSYEWQPLGPQRTVTGQSGVFLLPRRDLTPGITQPVSVGDTCATNRRARTPPIQASVHQRVFESYGADYRRAADYELDYLITPELGGAPDARNLWPQPYRGTEWSAYVKDELELHLHRLVCEGTIDFATAQREMATDWIAAYKRYFDTDRPRRDYGTSPLTERDGDLLLAELEELGVPARAGQHDGPTLMTMLQAARHDTHRLDTR